MEEAKANGAPNSVRFGPFEADLCTGELRKNGLKIRVQEQPFQALAALLERPGEMVSREELRKKLWPDETFVDFDTGLNKSIMKIREALDDSADTPRFVETLPRRGYRFIEPVERVGAEHAPLRISSIAVLPLENLSGDKEQEYFADGMTDQLINELGKIGAIRVISRTSVMQYKATRKPLSEVAGKLNVDAVLEGAVLRSGNRVRITAQLVRAATEKHLWAQSYEGDLNDVLALQRSVARGIASEIRIKLTAQEQTILAGARPVNPQAYEAYLKGLFFQNKLTPAALDKSVEFFKQAIELDSAYAEAYAGLSITHCYLGIFGLRPSREAFCKARVAAVKALELDGTLADAYTALGGVKKGYEWDWAAAEALFKRALALNPSSWLAHVWYADVLSKTGRFEEAIKEARQGRELDPVSASSGTVLGIILYRARRFDEAIRACQEALELDPNHLNALWFQAVSEEQKRQFPEAIEKLAKAVSLSDGPLYRALLANAYALTGERVKALSILDQLKTLSKQGCVSPVDMAIVYMGLDDRKSAFQWLEKAYQQRTMRIQELSEPIFDSLRSDPRFPDLMRRIGLSP